MEDEDRRGAATAGVTAFGVVLLATALVGIVAGLADATDKDMSFAETFAWAGATGGSLLIAGCVCIAAGAIVNRLDR